MVNDGERTSEKATIRLKVEITHGRIADSIIGNEACVVVTGPVCVVPKGCWIIGVEIR
jgi:hypothetical protein